MEDLPIEILQAGTNGAILLIIWNLFQTNRQLIDEIRSRDEQLLRIIDKLMELEDKNRSY